MSYKNDLKIDKFNLDDAWENQALLFCEWAEKAVEASFLRDKKKENLEIVRAEVDMEIRREAVRSGEKLTENAIASIIIQNSRYRNANKELLEAVKNQGVLNVAREAFDHRKKALEKLTELFLAGYFAEPRQTKTIREGREKQESATREDQYKEMDKSITRRRKNT